MCVMLLDKTAAMTAINRKPATCPSISDVVNAITLRVGRTNT